MNDFAAFDNTMGGAFAVIGESGVDFAAMNKGITPLFFTQHLPNEAETAKAGTLRTTEHEFVRLLCAGDNWSAPVHPVTDDIKERFAEHYEKWTKTRTNDHIAGTPLSQWPLANTGFVMEMKALNIRSIEDLAAVPDTAISKINNGRQLRERAQAWLDANKDAGTAARLATENQQLRDDGVEMKRQIADLAARLDAQDGTRRGPGRPSNASRAAEAA